MMDVGQIVTWVRKNKKKLAIGGLIGGSCIGCGIWFYASRHSEPLKSILQQFLPLQNQPPSPLKVDQLFEATERTSQITLLSLFPQLTSNLIAHFNVTSLKEAIKESTSKIDAWNNYKFAVFAQLLSSIYVIPVFVTFVNLELHLIAGSMFAANNQADTPEEGQGEGELLSKCLNHFLHTGMCSLIEVILKSAKKHIDAIDLKSKNIPKDFLWQVISSVRMEVENFSPGVENFVKIPLSSFFLPPDAPDFGKLQDLLRDNLDSSPIMDMAIQRIDFCSSFFFKHFGEHASEGQEQVVRMLKLVDDLLLSSISQPQLKSLLKEVSQMDQLSQRYFRKYYSTIEDDESGDEV